MNPLLAWLICGAGALEVGVPERFLPPRNYNPHPYTDPRAAIVQLRAIEDLPEHPYALFRRPPSRRDEDTAPIQFPKVPEAATPQPPPRLKPANVKHPLNVNRGRQFPPLLSLEQKQKKKYAFSYAVRDRSSGDDFSHSQARSGAQTKGEYRVKLPDGRTQIVSYTADHQGYRADVRYDEENFVEPPSTPVFKQSLYKPIYKPAQTIRPAYKAVYLDYDDLFPKPQREYTPIHEEDYGDVDANTVSTTPRYSNEAKAFTATATAKYIPSGTPRYVETFVANAVGSTPSSINTQQFYITTPSPSKYFVDADGQLFRQ
ncbi:unnamed protein product [Nezara viridula]|uniref:Uncharacterized protein n=1 Tax=Nezara viridula TaxID=85310 RepID=A0A9P0H5J2_NEZVI|nr:unnamed protein product [Nezara viridula]